MSRGVLAGASMPIQKLNSEPGTPASLVVGTSGVVFPAAELPINAHQLGKFVAEINPERSELSGYATVACRATAAEGLPELLNLLRSA